MIYKIQAPEHLCASIRLPASKSISNRALILNALCKNPYPIENLSDSDDTVVLLTALQSPGPDFDIGAAGTSMRFLTAYFAQLEGIRTITGSERMKNRPIGVLADALQRLGAGIEYLEKEGFPPLRIHGKKLKGGTITLDGGVSSQYISALMMIAPCLEQGLEIHLEGAIISQPYLRMTLGLMERWGVHGQWKGATIRIAPQSYQRVPFRVESDWSAASYWYEIRSLAPENAQIELLGLEENSLQGDARCKALFEDLSSTRFFHCDFTNEPDLTQTFAVTCCLLDIPFRFTGLQSLRIKETDRIAALQTELRKLGYPIEIENDTILQWTGIRCEPDPHPVIATYEDHRMAMAFAPVCLKTKTIRIAHPEAVSKSYPNYWRDLVSAGFIITEES
jgi:3-phosphoshikimate 1-carboxyvinyltransferase